MHPILFTLGPLTLRSYGLMTALAFLLGVVLAMALRRRAGEDPEPVMDLTVWVLVASLAGARLMYVLVQPQGFIERPWSVVALWEGGQVYYGGLLGGLLAAWLWSRRHAGVWGLVDAMTPALALGQALGRVGCFLNGCCYGGVNDSCGLVFPGAGPEPRLPVQLYEAGLCLALAALLAWRHGRRRFVGQVLADYLVAYPLIRFGLEFLRGDAERGSLLGLPWLSPGQWTSLGLLAVGLILRRRLAARAAKP